MDKPDRIALAVFALGAVQVIVLSIFIASGGGSSFADQETRVHITSYTPAVGSP